MQFLSMFQLVIFGWKLHTRATIILREIFLCSQLVFPMVFGHTFPGHGNIEHRQYLGIFENLVVCIESFSNIFIIYELKVHKYYVSVGYNE